MLGGIIDDGQGSVGNAENQTPALPIRPTTPSETTPSSVEATTKKNVSEQGRRPLAVPESACDTPSLFVGGLHPRISDLHLQKLFCPYGTIVRIHIATHNPSIQDKPNSSNYSKSQMPAKYIAGLQQSKGYAFVEYNSIESARLAISRLDGRALMGKTLAVRPSRRKKNDVSSGGFGSTKDATGDKGSAVTVEEARREYGAVQSKIEAVKRAIEQKKKGLP